MELAYRALKASKPEAIEIYFEKRSALKAESKDLKVDSVSRAEDVGLAIRVIHKKRQGFSFTTSLERSAIERAARTAIEIAEVMPEDPYAAFGKFETAALSRDDLGIFDSDGLRSPFEHKIKLAIELEKLTRAQDARIKAVRSSQFSQSHVRRALMDTSGKLLEEESASFSLSVTCKADDGKDQQMGGDYAYMRKLSRLPLQEVARYAAETATELLGAGKPKSMECPVILRNALVAELLEFLSSSFSAEQIDKGMSLLMGKQGRKVFSDHIHLVDDGLLPEGAGTSRFDGEGVASQVLTLIDSGVFKTVLTDRKYAAKLKLPLTGSASRGLKAPPGISSNNLILKPGFRAPGELIESIDNGLLLTELMGLHTANPVTGDFSLGASGILIERGELTKPVKGFAVAGNLMEVLSQIDDISHDLRFFGNVAAPSLKVARMSIGGE